MTVALYIIAALAYGFVLGKLHERVVHAEYGARADVSALGWWYRKPEFRDWLHEDQDAVGEVEPPHNIWTVQRMPCWLATKFHDGDPGDNWAVGFYDREEDGRHFVVDSEGKQIRHSGYRRVGRITTEYGNWLLGVAAKILEQSPPGSVSLWGMATDRALGQDQDANASGAFGMECDPALPPDTVEFRHSDGRVDRFKIES